MNWFRVLLHVWVWHYLCWNRPVFPRTYHLRESGGACLWRSVHGCECGYVRVGEWED